jgi:DNA-binding NtrC family response regulator
MIAKHDEPARKKVVVVVDDEPAILDSLRRLLRREPYELVTTSDPLEALKWIETRDVSVLIADERMPAMRGVDLLKTVRERAPATTRVVLTGYPNSGMIIERVNKGIQRLITKPWNDEELKRTIRELIEEREAEKGVTPA